MVSCRRPSGLHVPKRPWPQPGSPVPGSSASAAGLSAAPTEARASSMTRVRIDLLLVDRGLAPSRERARALLLAGQVRVGGHAVTKAGTLVDAAADDRAGDARPSVRRPRRAEAGARARGLRHRGRTAARRSTSAPPPAGSPTCCCSGAPGASSRWTSGTVSWTGRCATTRGSS